MILSLSMVITVIARTLSHNQYMIIIIISFFPVVSPVVIEHPQHQNVTSFEGIIMLSCTATGFPAPTITWFHNNSMEGNTSAQRINDYTTRSIVTISMPATNDSGMYYCTAAVDGFNDVDSNTVTVLVQGEHCSAIACTSFIVTYLL